MLQVPSTLPVATAAEKMQAGAICLQAASQTIKRSWQSQDVLAHEFQLLCCV